VSGELWRDDNALAVEQHIPALRRYARALARDPDRADDLVQDCLERAVSRFDQYQPGTNLRTWLFTILHNLHCDALRRQSRRGIHVPVDEWMENARSPAEQPRAMQLRDFRRAFRSLHENDQQILLLIGLEGFSYEEVSEVLDVAVGTVKSRLFRARERLRALESEMATPSAEVVHPAQ
jgi:RNA polymerase sigma-70 factor (ECF subfamily)